MEVNMTHSVNLPLAGIDNGDEVYWAGHFEERVGDLMISIFEN
jgi:hypothetical protein